MDNNEVFNVVLEDYKMENYEVYDRFTFDFLIRNLLREGYDHEQAKDIIISNYALSTLVMQERICNDFFLKISANVKISEDLLQLAYEVAERIKVFTRIDYNQFCKYFSEKEINIVLKSYNKHVDSTRISSQYYFDNSTRGKFRIKNTIYSKLQLALGYKIEPAPDEWDRLYNVDFYIQVGEKYMGLQIKPVNQGIQLSQIFKEKKLQLKTHQEFESKFGGKVFYIFSTRINNKKAIVNDEVIEEIRKEIDRLKEINKKIK